MAESSPIYQLMQEPLPMRTYQRRKAFRPSHEEVADFYQLINCYVFDSVLRQPDIRLGTIKKCWGACYWEDTQQPSGSYCKIRLSDKWFCQQWFLNTLAHEMVHQWQWDVYRFEYAEKFKKNIPVLSGAHGPSFFSWRDRFAEHGLTLKVAYGQRRWHRFQNFKKC